MGLSTKVSRYSMNGLGIYKLGLISLYDEIGTEMDGRCDYDF